MTEKPFLAAGLAALLLLPLAALANDEGTPPPESPHSFSANVGAVGNYVWRGLTQTDNGPALQGGLDYSHASGLYAGTWASNVNFGEDSPSFELDLYLGYTGALLEDLEYDLNVLYYAYPDGEDSDFAEAAGNLTYKWFTLGLAYTFYGQNEDGLYDQGDWYFQGDFEYAELPYDLILGLHLGYTDFKNGRIDDLPNADYWDYGASLGKELGEFGTVSVNYAQNNGDPDSDMGFDNDPMFWLGWLKEF